MAQIIKVSHLLRERCIQQLGDKINVHGRAWNEATQDSSEEWKQEVAIGKLIVMETDRSIYDIPRPLQQSPHIYIIGLIEEFLNLPEKPGWNWGEFFTRCVARYLESLEVEKRERAELKELMSFPKATMDDFEKIS